MRKSSVFLRSIATVATSAVIAGAIPATASAQGLPPLPPLPSPEQIQAIAAGAVVVLGAAAAASSGEGGLNTESLNGSGSGSPVAPGPPSSTKTQFLSDMRPVNGSPRTGSKTVNGASYPNSVYRAFGGCTESVTYGYDIARNWNRFQATMGIADNSRSDAVVKYEFYGDGAKLGSTVTSRLGTSTPVDLAVAGVLRLELRASFVEGSRGMCSDSGTWVWGNARVTR